MTATAASADTGGVGIGNMVCGNDRCPRCLAHHPSGYDCAPKPLDLATLTPRKAEGWQDISTAPKTDADNMVARPFIGWCPEPEADGGGDQRICWWEPKTAGGVWWSDRDLPEHPVLWQPLPAAPTAEVK